MKRIVAILIAIGLMMLVPTNISYAEHGPPVQPENEIGFFERLTIVEYDDSCFNDDFIYLSAIPTSIYYQEDSLAVSSLIFDEISTNERYLVQDIAECWGSNTQIVCIGNVNTQIIDDFESIAQPSEIINIISPEDTVDSYAAEIATNFWDTSDRAVLAPLSESDDDGNYVPLGDDDHSYVEYVQAASNGAIIASLLDCPLLYVETSLLQTTIDALTELSVSEVIIIRPADFDSTTINQELSGMGISVIEELSEIEDTIQFIRLIKNTNYLTLIYNNYEERKKPWTSNYVYAPTNGVSQYENSAMASETNSAAHVYPVHYLENNYCISQAGGHWYWTDPEEPGTIGENDEMPFGPAAYIGAFHASPLITFPTENAHCQNADDSAEAIGDWFYDVYKHNSLYGIIPRFFRKLINMSWWDDTPNFDDMMAISTEFYAWLDDINADNPIQRENIIIVGDIAEIDPSLDRAIMGKSIAGRIGSGEGPASACIINRNVLYPELVQINQGNDVTISMVAYAHELDFTDNNGVLHVVSESEDVPLAYDQAGYNVNYHTTLEDTTNALSSGVRFWAHVGHGYYGDKPVVGTGVFNYFLPEDAWRAYEQGGSPEYPDQYNTSIWTPPDGEVNPPGRIEPLKGIVEKMSDLKYTDVWTEMSGNLHSTAIYFLLCNVGGCQMPVLWQKNGASVVFASYASVSFDGGGQFSIRLNQEIANGETFGDAFLTALQEISSLYSEGTQGQGVDDTLQYIIYGDPSLVLIQE